ncbi:MAG: hypothetical protein VX730_07840 [Pseudomonadota bacterium]|nr:hypothetical protein [Pseudomonadota bacterium]
MTQPTIMLNSLHMHIERRRATDLMRVLWRHKYGNESNQANAAAAMLTLRQTLEVYLLSGGDPLDVAPIFEIKRADVASMLHETSKTHMHWQNSADIISDNDNRSDDQKISIRMVAEIYKLLKDSITQKMHKTEG